MSMVCLCIWLDYAEFSYWEGLKYYKYMWLATHLKISHDLFFNLLHVSRQI